MRIKGVCVECRKDYEAAIENLGFLKEQAIGLGREAAFNLQEWTERVNREHSLVEDYIRTSFAVLIGSEHGRRHTS